jgi:hypothetical protein
MKDELPSMAVRRHLRDALVLGWTGYGAALLAAVTLGVGTYALAMGDLWFGIAGLLVTAALGLTIVGALFYCLNEHGDRRDQWYLRLALRIRYLRAHPDEIEVRRP